jgi:hypothetical protein
LTEKLHLDNEKILKTNRKVRTGETRRTPRGTFSSSNTPLSLQQMRRWINRSGKELPLPWISPPSFIRDRVQNLLIKHQNHLTIEK